MIGGGEGHTKRAARGDNGSESVTEPAQTHRGFPRLLAFVALAFGSSMGCLPPTIERRELTNGVLVRFDMRRGASADTLSSSSGDQRIEGHVSAVTDSTVGVLVGSPARDLGATSVTIPFARISNLEARVGSYRGLPAFGGYLLGAGIGTLIRNPCKGRSPECMSVSWPQFVGAVAGAMAGWKIGIPKWANVLSADR